MRRGFWGWAVVCMVLAGACAWACGWRYPEGFFSPYPKNDPYALPELLFDDEYIRIFGDIPPALREEPAWPQGNPQARSISADIDDLEACIGDAHDAEAVLCDYERLREALQGYEDSSRNPHNRVQRTGAEAALFDLTPFEDILARVPEEFALYIQGAAAYHGGAYEDAEHYFKKVLTLEKGERMWRSVWAAFMLGKTLGAMDKPVQGARYFEGTRQLADAGFKDSLCLVEDSWGLQAREASRAGDHLAAIDLYIEYRKIPGRWAAAGRALNWNFSRLLGAETIPASLIHNDMLRQLVTAWICARSDTAMTRKGEKWLEATVPLATNDAVVPGAERLAWLAYQCGRMDDAERWLACSAPEAPPARWVRAKLLLRAGHIEAGLALLEDLAQSPDTEAWRFGSLRRQTPARTRLRVDAAHALLMADRYAEAVETLLTMDRWSDAAFVAERIMTLQELRHFVSVHKTNEALTRMRQHHWRNSDVAVALPSWMTLMGHLLARRLARADCWAEAIPHYPDVSDGINNALRDAEGEQPCLRERAGAVLKHLEAGRDATRPAHARARHLFEAAETVRRDGMDLMGTELTPDWRSMRGGAYYFTEASMLQSGNSVLTRQARERIARSAPEPDKRFHYRYIAAALMNECAELLPDNNVLTAKALHQGGMYLMLRDPEAADPFYKALVRRNPNLLIARQADELRWFPAEFTDEVLYTPRKPPGVFRRTIASIRRRLRR